MCGKIKKFRTFTHIKIRIVNYCKNHVFIYTCDVTKKIRNFTHTNFINYDQQQLS